MSRAKSVMVALNPDAIEALRHMLSHRDKLWSAETTDAHARADAREQVRSYAVDVVNEMLRDNPELRTVRP